MSGGEGSPPRARPRGLFDGLTDAVRAATELLRDEQLRR
jgi:hypothetical protein